MKLKDWLKLNKNLKGNEKVNIKVLNRYNNPIAKGNWEAVEEQTQYQTMYEVMIVKDDIKSNIVIYLS